MSESVCPMCHGEGRKLPNWRTCPVCDGEGTLPPHDCPEPYSCDDDRCWP